MFTELRTVDGAGGGIILSKGVTTGGGGAKWEEEGAQGEKRMKLEVNEGVCI